MSVDVRMPELSSDMTEADLVTWLVKPGDRVAAGDLIAELETEKSTVEFESPVSGTLLEIVVPEGTNGVQVGTVLARFESDGGETATPSSREAEAEPPGASAARAEPEREAVMAEATSAAATEEPASAAQAPAPEPEAAGAPSGERGATALARRVAAQSGVTLSQVTGSGPGGRILKADVQAAAIRETESDAPPAGSREPVPFESETPFELVPLSRMRRTIASRLAEAKRTIPHFYLRVECEIDRLLELRGRFNAGEHRISVNDFVVRAAALALVEVPEANVSFREDALVQYQRADVAVAVATEGGLLTPIVREADRKELTVLSQELRELASRAREGRLAPREYQGGSFTVSNLGMYGVESVYPIVNPPQSCILGVGAGVQRPVVRNGGLAVGTVMTCTLCADHRAVDGAVGARWLAALKRRLEDPLEMLL